MLLHIQSIIKPRIKKKTNHLKETSRVCVVRCDMCKTEFKRQFSKVTINAKRHFCTHKCSAAFSKKGNRSDHKEIQERRMASVVANNLEKHGVEHGFQRPDVRTKSLTTMMKNYGVNNPQKSLEIREKTRETVQQKYGVDHVFKAESVKQKIKNTCFARYGVEHSGQAKEVKAKIVSTLMKNWGVSSGWQSTPCRISYTSDDAINKRKHTMIERYGVDCGFNIQWARIKQIESVKDPLRMIKCHESMKRNGSYKTSKVENEFYLKLCETFSGDTVERQAVVNNWRIDFLITSSHTYVQVDGVYWHGLDRSLEDIKKFKSPRDITILGTHQRDIEQNSWFASNNVSLVRITDTEIKADIKSSTQVVFDAQSL